jgi:protein-tyrosine phosphatase
VIDTHCHLLPGLDDGPGSETEALELARRLVSDGVQRVLCTPHYSNLFPTDHARATERHRALTPQLETGGIQLETSLAAEIGPGFAVSAPLEELLDRTIDRRFALVEVLPDTPPSALEAIRKRFDDVGLRVILAHPERCRALHRRPALLDPLRDEGVLVQVVAPSLIGRWGPDVEGTAWRLVDTGRADLLGSDAHGASRRRPHLREACDLIDQRLGPEVVAELTERRPKAVLDNAPGGRDAY